MTLRLVGLMSVVLLLSLAAFGLLTAHYQDQVMQEVARTASDVGKATLRTLEIQEHATTLDLQGKGESVFTWSTVDGGPTAGESVRPVRRTLIVRSLSDVDAERHLVLDDSAHVVTLPPHSPDPAVPSEGVAVAAAAKECLEQQLGDGRHPASIRISMTTGEGGQVMLEGDVAIVDLEEVHVESAQDAQGQMTLRIPTFAPARQRASDAPPSDPTDDGSGETELVADEIRLPFSVADYDTLFRSLRNRSLALFVGVFAVGVVLSGGLAARFTRPVRRLDAGIRRLSDGDLDVRVDVQGRDEIARLGMAFNDMTRKLRANRERERDMVRREKLSALGGLAAGVAHDVRNPLHSIGLTLQHLSETCRPEGEHRGAEFDRSVDIIRGEIRRLDRLVENFLSFARSDRRERQAVDLRDLLEETARLVRKEAEWRGVEVKLDLPQASPAVAVDGESLRSSILNLVLNSFEAMPDGGTLELSLRVAEDAVIVEVADTGEGIPEAERERVFEFAYTTREGGSGLGLAMVYQCVAVEHGGRVSIDSSLGQGTRVSLTLPLAPPTRGEEDGTA